VGHPGERNKRAAGAGPQLDRRDLPEGVRQLLAARAPTPIDAGRYSGIVFWVHGGNAGKRSLTFYIQQSDSGGESRKAQFEAPPGSGRRSRSRSAHWIAPRRSSA
jgi:hypothetical protein